MKAKQCLNESVSLGLYHIGNRATSARMAARYFRLKPVKGARLQILFTIPTLPVPSSASPDITLPPRPTPRLRLARLPRHVLNLGIEALVVQALPLGQHEPDVADGMVMERAPERTAVGRSLCGVGRTKRPVGRERDHQRRGVSDGVSPVAGPTVAPS